MSTWEEIFKKHGSIFSKIQRDIPKLATVLKQKSFQRILDIGCGSGRYTVYFAKRGFDVYAFDSSRTGVSYTKKWLKREKLKANVIVHNMAKRFPYPDNFFDAVISIQVIHHNRLYRIRKTIKEIKRVLKKDGIIFITVPISKNQCTNSKTIAPHTYVPLDGREEGLVHYLFSKKRIYEEFRDFKIKDIHLYKHTHFCIFGSKK